MTWPTDDLDTAHLDEGSDSPAQARPMLYRLVQRVKSILSARGSTGGVCELDNAGTVPAARIRRGEANGVCELDAAGTVPANRLPTAAATAAGAGLVRSNNVISHGDTSQAASVSNVLLTGITVDDYGHVVTIQGYSDRPAQYTAWSDWVTQPFEHWSLTRTLITSGGNNHAGTPLLPTGRIVIVGVEQQTREANIQHRHFYYTQRLPTHGGGELAYQYITIAVQQKRSRYQYINLN